LSFGDWLDERTGHRALIRAALDEHVPGGAKWAYVFGSALTLSLVVQAATGVALMSAYAPSATTAWSSVAYISYSLSWGWLVRGLHHFGAQAMVVLLAAHLIQTAIYGAYRRPREVNWYFGLGLAMVTLGFALTGYLLPWDQKGYWATRVATNILGTLPLVGAWLQRLVVGGGDYGHLTLTHFYALHVAVLPVAAIVLVVGHIALFRRHGVTPPASADVTKVETFWPKQAGKDLIVGAVVLLVIFALAIREHGAPLDAPADPASEYPARPEWYFLALFQLLKYFKGSLEPVGAIGVPALVVGYAIALPLLDKKEKAKLGARAGYLAVLGVFGAGAIALTVVANQSDANDATFQAARRAASERAARAVVLFREGVPPEGALAMMRNDPETRGGEIFQASCASCHALGEIKPKDGKTTAPDLAGYGSRAWVLGLLEDPDAARYFGGSCFAGNMPSMVTPPQNPEAAAVFTAMKEEDRNAVADFLAAQAKGERGEGMPGEKIVKQRCTSCHRLDGKVDDDDALGPELRGWASSAWIEAQITDPASGKTYPKGAMSKDLKGHMPAFKEKLGAEDRALVVKWLLAKR
jgi:ubiquinol-cytochrome c reductase cytochrome b subunit